MPKPKLFPPQPLPDKAYFSAIEVAAHLGIHYERLKYWTRQYRKLDWRVKRTTAHHGRSRQYSLDNVRDLKQVYSYIYDDGYTLQGAIRRTELEKFKKDDGERQKKRPIFTG